MYKEEHLLAAPNPTNTDPV